MYEITIQGHHTNILLGLRIYKLMLIYFICVNSLVSIMIKYCNILFVFGRSLSNYYLMFLTVCSKNNLFATFCRMILDINLFLIMFICNHIICLFISLIDHCFAFPIGWCLLICLGFFLTFTLCVAGAGGRDGSRMKKKLHRDNKCTKCKID